MAVLISPSSPWILRCGRCLAGVLVVLLVWSAGGQTANVEYRIKAAYLFNFAKFVSWPSAAFPSAESPIVIGILGKDPFGNEIDETIADKAIERRSLRVKRLGDNESWEGCHILFIASSERKALPQILQKLGTSPILTVAEMEEFTEIGGMIRFFSYENNIRFAIDLAPVDAAGLKISSKLLQVAVVKGMARK
jgi:hypothetical protein